MEDYERSVRPKEATAVENVELVQAWGQLLSNVIN